MSAEIIHDKECEWEGEQPIACDCRIRKLQSRIKDLENRLATIKTCSCEAYKLRIKELEEERIKSHPPYYREWEKSQEENQTLKAELAKTRHQLKKCIFAIQMRTTGDRSNYDNECIETGNKLLTRHAQQGGKDGK